jgi:hypothetical protein
MLLRPQTLAPLTALLLLLGCQSPTGDAKKGRPQEDEVKKADAKVDDRPKADAKKVDEPKNRPPLVDPAAANASRRTSSTGSTASCGPWPGRLEQGRVGEEHQHHRREREGRRRGQRAVDGASWARPSRPRPSIKTDGLDPDTARKLHLIKTTASPPPAPSDPAKRKELAELGAKMEGIYGKGKACKDPKQAEDLQGHRRAVGHHRPRAATTTSCLRRLVGLAQGHRQRAAPAVQPLRRARQRGRRGDRLQGPRRAVALRLRHEPRRVRDRRPSACGRRSSRSTTSCTVTCAPRWSRSTARTRSRRPASSPRTCSATCGPRSGATSTRSSSPTRAPPASTSPRR